MTELDSDRDSGRDTGSDVDRAQELGALFELHGRRLYRLALRMVGDPASAEDLVQEAFLRAARRPLRPTPSANEAWLVRVVVNLARDDYRRRRTRTNSAAALASVDCDAVDVAAGVVARRDVATALARLPVRRRAVVVLHELEELDVATIARLLGIARVTVRWHLAAGRAELRRRLLAPAAGPEPPIAASEKENAR